MTKFSDSRTSHMSSFLLGLFFLILRDPQDFQDKSSFFQDIQGQASNFRNFRTRGRRA